MLPAIDGLRYVPDYLDPATHDFLLASADVHPWHTSADRRVQVHGYRYHHPTRSVFHIGELPPWANDLAVRLCRDGLLPYVADQLVVNSYQPGSGIVAHVDQDVLGDHVASVTLGSSCVMQFDRRDTGPIEEVLLESRSVLVLAGEARGEWRHGIPARAMDIWRDQERPRGRRVSLTFRIISPVSPAASCRG